MSSAATNTVGYHGTIEWINSKFKLMFRIKYPENLEIKLPLENLLVKNLPR